MDEDVAESWEPLELMDEIRSKPDVVRQAAHCANVFVEPIAAPGRKLPRHVDDELTHGQKREQNVIVERQIAREVLWLSDCRSRARTGPGRSR